MCKFHFRQVQNFLCRISFNVMWNVIKLMGPSLNERIDYRRIYCSFSNEKKLGFWKRSKSRMVFKRVISKCSCWRGVFHSFHGIKFAVWNVGLDKRFSCAGSGIFNAIFRLIGNKKCPWSVFLTNSVVKSLAGSWPLFSDESCSHGSQSTADTFWNIYHGTLH